MRNSYQPAVAGSAVDFYYFDAIHVNASIWDTEDDFSEEFLSSHGSLLPS